jgi:hypothetical protein
MRCRWVRDVEMACGGFAFFYCTMLSVCIRPEWMRYRKDISYA